jgi:hypothetical protein
MSNKIIRLTESDFKRYISKIIKENTNRVDYEKKLLELNNTYNKLLGCQFLSNFDIKKDLHLVPIDYSFKNKSTGKKEFIKACKGLINVPMRNVPIKDRQKSGSGAKIWFYFEKTHKTIDEIRNLIQQGDPKIIGLIQNKIKEHSERFYQCSQFDDYHTDWASE